MQNNSSDQKAAAPVYTESYRRLITRHAQTRMQQRAIPVAVLTRLLDYGAEVHDHRGAIILYFDHASWEKLVPIRREYALKQLERYRNVYAVIDGNGQVATVGRRYRRIPRT